MEFAESTLLAVAAVLMIAAALISLIPYIPGPLIVWGVGISAAALTGFSRVSPAAVAVMTALMLAGMTSAYWLPFLGMRGDGMSCLGALGSIAGGLLGTFLIPVPVVGTLIGMFTGTLVVEFARVRRLRHAVRSGGVALRLYFAGILVDLGFSLAIFAAFIISVWTTR